MTTRRSSACFVLLAAAFASAQGCGGSGRNAAGPDSQGPPPERIGAASGAPGADLAASNADGSASPSGYVSLDAALSAGENSFASRESLDERSSDGSRFDPWLGLFGEIDGLGGRPTQTPATENIMQVTFASEGRDAEPDADKTGEYIVYSSTQHNRAPDIYTKKVDGLTVVQLTSDPGSDRMPKFSPDNSQIAFCSDRGGNYDIYIMDAASGGQAVQVTSDSAHEIHPSWSPDGKHLVYCRLSEQSGRWELWVTETGNFNSRRFIGYGLCPEWNPDPGSNLIAFQRPRERGSRLFSIWTLEFVNGEGVKQTEIVSAANAAAINPSWSPDGRMLCFTTVIEPGRPGQPGQHLVTERETWADIWVVNLDGTNKVNLTNGEYTNVEPTWSPDGRILFVSNRAGIENIWAVGPDRTIQTARGPAMNAPNTGVAEVQTQP